MIIDAKTSLTTKSKLVIMAISLLFAVAFLLSTIIISHKAKMDAEIREAETLITGIVGSINANIGNYKDISRLIMLNEDVITYLRTDTPTAGLANDVHIGISTVLNVSNNVDSVFIFRNDGIYTSTGRGEYALDTDKMSDLLWLSSIMEKRGGAVIFMNGNGALYRKNGNQLITISRAIYDIFSQQKTGILLMNISMKMLDQILYSQNSDTLCIVTPDGDFLAGNPNLVSCFCEDFLSTEITHLEILEGGQTHIVSGVLIEDLPFVVLCSNEPHYVAMPWEALISLILIILAFLLSIFMESTFLRNNITGPLTKLTEGIEQTKQEVQLKRLEMELPDNEIGILAQSYNSAVDHANQLTTNLVEKEKMLQHAQMRVLQEQIKPHFLYNSLETISFLALEANAPQVQDALETLGSFYRNFLSKGDRDIPLRRELTIIQDYLSLQKLRYGEVINDAYEVDDQTLDILIPKLILQPLVENSIYHGIRMTGEPGTITIRAHILEDQMLHIVVRDSGIGMSQETIEQLLCEDYHELEEEGHGRSSFGLRGTIERIRNYCNSKDVIQIRSEEGEYTEIELTLPSNRTSEYP